MTALLGVGAAVVVLLLVTVATARRPAAAVLPKAAYLDRWSVLHGGYDPRRALLVRGWLAATYAVGHPLASAGVRPDLLTLWGVAVGGGVVLLAGAGGGWWLLAAAAAVVITGLLDGLDGCVAVLTDRAGRFGFVLDSVADRVVDGLYLLALWRVGAPASLCVSAAAAVALLEYTRARAGQAGMAEIGVVTVGERPTRVVVAAVMLAAAGAIPAQSSTVASFGAVALVALSLVALGQLLVVVRRILR